MKLEDILREEKKRKTLAISQVISIILSTIAFAYILASAFPVVSGAQTEQCVRMKKSSFEDIVITKLPAVYPQNIFGAQGYCDDNGYDQICDYPYPCPEEPPIILPSPLPPPNPPALVLPSSLPSSLTSVVPGLSSVVPGLVVGKEAVREGGGAMTKGFFGTKIGGYGTSTLTIGGLLTTAGYAAAIYAGISLVLSIFGASPELTKSLSTAISVGFFTAAIASKLGLVEKLIDKLWLDYGIEIGAGVVTLGIAIAVAALIFVLTYHSVRYDLYAFTCSSWDVPTGGRYCEECNKGDFPCTEYSCKSLGQACELDNQGTSEEVCVWKNRGDVSPPVIQPWTETLTTDYKYAPDNTISPPDRGVRIVPENNNKGCIAPFTPLRFGVTLDEAAKCKIDFADKGNFDEMSFFFGGSSTSKYNHSQTMSLPSPQALEIENITLENGGEFTLYSRCQDANGNSNTANFIFKFCVDKGPDTTPPLIVTTSILNGMPIAFGKTSVDLQVFVNEPAECRWSRVDKSYNDMEMENQMSCKTNVFEFNAQMLYQCSTNLTGLNDRTNNDFYFRCLDQPHLRGTENENDRNANTQSYKFTLIGTQPLVIDSIKPNGTIKDSTDIIRVTLEARTSAGFKEGAALCYFSETGDEGSYVQFFETGAHKHSQDLFLPEGGYTYHIMCIDLGGNTDTNKTRFNVESDSEAPVVVRAFREENFLKIITNEKASCVYGTSTQNACNYLFEDGITMQSLENNKHQTAWDPDMTFYIKCKDEFGNQPLPNECSIIARPFGK